MTEVEEVKSQFIGRLKRDFPALRFKMGRKFTFRPPKTIILEQKSVDEQGTFVDGRLGFGSKNLVDQNFDLNQNQVPKEQKSSKLEQKNAFYYLQILHEVGHALLEHRFYQTDVERLKMERAAWEKARELCPRYGVEYDEDFVEEALDSYRDWLHVKSKCPKCGATRFQDVARRYFCPDCDGYKV